MAQQLDDLPVSLGLVPEALPESLPLSGPVGVRPEAAATRVDRAFTLATRSAASAVLLVLVLMLVFLSVEAEPALTYQGWSFFTTAQFRGTAHPPVLGALGLLLGTIVVGLIAVTIAIPVSTFTALFITDFAGDRLRRALIATVDLLAAIPSLLYGLWGFSFLSDKVPTVSQALSGVLGFIPVFRIDDGAVLISSYFLAGVVVSLMCLPIITSVVREVFAQTPVGEKEAALALGATRWHMIRTVVFPFGRGGIIGGSMLGLGRALGETIACSILLPQIPGVDVHIFQYGGATLAGFIASNVGAQGLMLSGLLALGLVLFLFTLATNTVASIVVARSRSGRGLT